MSECPVCEKKFETETGLRNHASRMHKDVFRQHFPEPRYSKPGPKYDDETIQELVEQSNKNLLRWFKGSLTGMSTHNKQTLYRNGVIREKDGKPVRRGQRGSCPRYVFTEKGKALLEELKK